MKIFITGIRGFLASHLARALEARGHQVRGSATAGDLPRIRLGQPIDPAIFADADTVIHAAHDFRSGTLETNVTGARLIFDAARGRRRILISSHSARADAASEYGISKYRIESFYREEAETIVRPGLVLGNGGSFGRHLASIRKSPVIPLIDGGRNSVATLALTDFNEAMVRIVEVNRPGVWNLFNKQEPTMRQIVDLVLKLTGHRAWVVSIPYGLALAALRAGEGWLPVDSGSLQSMRLNSHRVHESNLRELIAAETSWQDAIRLAVRRDSELPNS